eukprot:scaffold142959_cov15-Tisochrysis_lutea.AAC.1
MRPGANFVPVLQGCCGIGVSCFCAKTEQRMSAALNEHQQGGSNEVTRLQGGKQEPEHTKNGQRMSAAGTEATSQCKGHQLPCILKVDLQGVKRLEAHGRHEPSVNSLASP